MKLKTFTAILKSGVIIAAVSWLLSFIVMAVCWVARIEGGYLNNYIRDMITAFAVIFFIVTAIYTAVWLIKNTKLRRILRLRDEKGYTDEYFSALKDKHKLKSKFSTALKNALFLSGEFADANRFDEALETLEVIDSDSCNISQKTRLASEYLKIYSLVKDEDKAKSFYITANEILFSAKLRGNALAYAKYSNSLYEYLSKDYEKASKSAYEAYDLSSDKKLKADACLMLALSCLKNGDKEGAKHYTEVSSKQISTPAQKENLLSLMTAVERSYGI